MAEESESCVFCSLMLEKEAPEGVDIPLKQPSCWNPLFWPFTVYFLQACQRILLQCGCCSWLLFIFYLIDVAAYTSDKLMWLYSRRQLFGDYFCGLGRLNCVSYQKVAEIVSDLQLRDNFLGRARMKRSSFPEHFLLFEDTAGNGESHQHYRQSIIDSLLGPAAIDRSNDSYAAALSAQVAANLHKSKRDAPFATPNLLDCIKLQFPENVVGDFVIKWMHYVLLGIKLDEIQEVDFDAFRKTMSQGGFVKSRISGLPSCLRPRQEQIYETHILNIYVKHAISQLVTWGETYYSMSSRELAEYSLAMIAIAATLGGMNLLAATLNSHILEMELPNISSDSALQNFILEAARRWAPVGSINILLPEAATVRIGTKDHTFKKGTPLAANLALASLDERQFQCPFQFQANRPEMAQRTINFNAVSLEPTESCPYGAYGQLRVCPGRFLGLTMTKQVLKAYHRPQA